MEALGKLVCLALLADAGVKAVAEAKAGAALSSLDVRAEVISELPADAS